MILSSAASGRERTDRAADEMSTLQVGRPQHGMLKGYDHLRLSASGMAIKQQLAVVAFSNREAWCPVVMRRATRHPNVTNPLAAKGVREFGSAHDKPPSASRRLM